MPKSVNRANWRGASTSRSERKSHLLRRGPHGADTVPASGVPPYRSGPLPLTTGIEPLLELADLREEILDLDARVLEFNPTVGLAKPLKMPLQDRQRRTDRRNRVARLLVCRGFWHRRHRLRCLWVHGERV